jgi:nucleoside-diphosphate-sugar epimerase
MLDTVARRGNGSKPPIRIPRSVIHSLGPVAGLIDSVFGVSVFPFSSKMAKMATKTRFYSIEKAKSELNYSPTPFAEHVDETIEWYVKES